MGAKLQRGLARQVVDTGSVGQERAAVGALVKRPWVGVKVLAETAAERLGSLVACAERDLHDGFGGFAQLPGGSFEAQSSDQLVQRLAHHAREDAVEVKPGKRCDGGEVIEREFLVQVRVNVLQDAQDAGLVVLEGGGLHGHEDVLADSAVCILIVLAELRNFSGLRFAEVVRGDPGIGCDKAVFPRSARLNTKAAKSAKR